jgi:hypothetical protein
MTVGGWGSGSDYAKATSGKLKLGAIQKKEKGSKIARRKIE